MMRLKHVGTWIRQLPCLNLKGALGSINNSRRAVYGFDQRVEVFGSKGLLTAHNVKETHVEHKDGNGCHMDKHLLLQKDIRNHIYMK